MTLAKNFDHDNSRSWESADWAALGADSIGEIVEPPFSGRTMMSVSGNFDGARVRLEGSLDGVLWFGRPDTVVKIPIYLAEPMMREFVGGAPYLRPKVIGGGPETAVDVSIVVWPR